MAAGTRRSKEGTAAKVTSATTEDKTKSNQTDSSSNSAIADSKATAGQPLGPPPRPAQSNPNDADYFSQNHNQTANNGYQAEPNPFEQQFGNPAADTPGKLLPSVAQLTSPQSLLPNTPSEMRLGPLSPAMLAGPASGDYFDSAYPRSFPTPNESSLRTGLTPGGGSMLTPGGGGSMFPPAPSPNTQALFNSFALSGVNTPSLGDFMRSAVATKAAGHGNGSGPTSRPSAQTTEAMDLKVSDGQNNTPNGVFAHPESDAANGLFMLAQANGGRPANQFSVPTAQSTAQASSSLAGISQPPQAQGRRKKESIGSSDSQGDDQSDSDRSEEVVKPATRSRGKKPAAEAKTPANNRRKAADTPAKGSTAKRRKVSVSQDADMDMDDDDMEENSKDTKKMTDEEKRKNFLERNRVAALKCRQRKKQWLSNLQSKVDIYSQENDALQQCCNQLRDQVSFLKNALASHRGCPIFQNMGISQQQFEALLAMEVAVPYVLPPNSAPNGGVQSMPMMAPTGQVLPPR